MSDLKKSQKRLREDERGDLLPNKRTETVNDLQSAGFLSARSFFAQDARTEPETIASSSTDDNRLSDAIPETNEHKEANTEQVSEQTDSAISRTMLIVIGCERNLRILRVDLNRKIASVQQCNPLYVLSTIRTGTFVSPILLIGSAILRHRIQSVAASVGLSYYYEKRFSDNDVLLLRYCLSMHTKFTQKEIENFTICGIENADGCAPLCLTTVSRFNLVPKELRCHTPGAMSLVDVCCNSTWTKDLLASLLRSPPPRAIAENMRAVCKEFQQLGSGGFSFKSTPNYTSFVTGINVRSLQTIQINAICGQFTKMQKLIFDKRYSILVEKLQPIVRFVCVTRGIAEIDWNFLRIKLAETIKEIKSLRRNFAAKNQTTNEDEEIGESKTGFDEELAETDDRESEEDSDEEKDVNEDAEEEAEEDEKEITDTRLAFSSSPVIENDYFRSMEWSLYSDDSPGMMEAKTKIGQLVQVWTKAIEMVRGARMRAVVVRPTRNTNKDAKRKCFNYKLVFVDEKENCIEETDQMIVAKYRYEAAIAKAKAQRTLRPNFSDLIDIKLFVYVWHFLLVFETLRQCVTNASLRAWTIAEMTTNADGLKLRAFRPYWMSTVFSTANDIELNRITVLTGRNAGGKSVCLTAVGAIALLANCGLMVPCESAIVPFYDSIFLCGTAFDLSSENRSAQEVSVGDVAMIADCITKNTLVLLDCVADSTEAEDASRNTAGLLEFFDKVKCPATMIATHALHVADRVRNRRDFNWKVMQMLPASNVPGDFEYKLSDGICTNSMGSAPFFRLSRNKMLLDCLAAHCATVPLPLPAPTISNDDIEKICDVFVAKVLLVHQRYDKTLFGSSKLTKITNNDSLSNADARGHFCYLRRNCETKRVYVGESATINKRMQQHHKENPGERFDFYIIKVANASVAKHAETIAIISLDRMGILFDSKFDGKRKIKGEVC